MMLGFQVDPYDQAILRFLMLRSKATTNEISNYIGASWNTVNNHLMKLKRLGFVSSMVRGGITYWEMRK